MLDLNRDKDIVLEFKLCSIRYWVQIIEIILLNFGFCGASLKLKYLQKFESGLTILGKGIYYYKKLN